MHPQEEEKVMGGGFIEENPLEVPAEKEDKKTADEEGSAGIMDEREDVIMRENDIFDHSMRDYSNNIQEG